MTRYSILLVVLATVPAFALHGEKLTAAVFIVNADGSDQHSLFSYPLDASGLACSPDGTRIAYSGPDRNIWMANMDGSDSVNLTKTEELMEYSPAWSPDGTRIAYSARPRFAPADDVFVLDIASGNVTNLTDSPSSDWRPTWSPDSKRIAFTSDRDGAHQIYVVDSSGGTWSNLTNDLASGIHYTSPSWSPDGSRIAYAAMSSEATSFGVLNLADGSRQTLSIDQRIPGGEALAWSFDGTRVAFSADEERDGGIFLMDLATGDVVSLTHGIGINEHPTWTRDGSIVFTTRRTSSEMVEDLGPDTVFTIIEEGGFSLSPRSGDTPAIRLQRTGPDGKPQFVPLSKTEAETLLRQRGVPPPRPHRP